MPELSGLIEFACYIFFEAPPLLVGFTISHSPPAVAPLRWPLGTMFAATAAFFCF